MRTSRARMWSKCENAIDTNYSKYKFNGTNFIENIKLLRKTAVSLLPSNETQNTCYQIKLAGFGINTK